ncbi:Preprotein translocase subunit SCY2, chloroplastic [Vitis vinifera]|uniref:Preprotein translocase subunit SCY2, chloroplastic n=1 Tax=Vitis vinifera TaxID=29760 RepID=A0A438F4I8_VITVI|nr:Preprotein translocase subunit SCY2, chloroplastic [Vitis vinifera]
MRPTGHSPNAKLPIEMRVQWMEHEQRSRGLEHGDEHFRFFMCTRATFDSPERCESRHGSNSSELSSFQSPILLSKTLQISRSVHLFGGQVEHGLQLCCPFYARTNVSLKLIWSESSARRFSLLSRPFLSRANKKLCVNFSEQLRSDYLNAEATPLQSVNDELFPQRHDDGSDVFGPHDVNNSETLQPRTKMFRNRFLNFARLGSVLNNAAESFFKSEIRRRLFVTAVLLVISRVGYFIPLPGFDRRLMPEDYLSFVSGSVDELGDFAGELKLSLFQLGISPQIAASILMQVLCHVVPSLVKLRKEGLDGHEKIKSYIWWISLGFAILEALVLACYSLTYSVYAASHRVKHVMVTTLFLVCGAMTMTWICDKISESGFGISSAF